MIVVYIRESERKNERRKTETVLNIFEACFWIQSNARFRCFFLNKTSKRENVESHKYFIEIAVATAIAFIVVKLSFAVCVLLCMCILAYIYTILLRNCCLLRCQKFSFSLVLCVVCFSSGKHYRCLIAILSKEEKQGNF